MSGDFIGGAMYREEYDDYCVSQYLIPEMRRGVRIHRQWMRDDPEYRAAHWKAAKELEDKLVFGRSDMTEVPDDAGA